MSDKRMTRMNLTTALETGGHTDWARLRREAAAGIEPERDEEEMDIDWTEARVVASPGKVAMSIRLDADVHAFFRDQGKGYQTRINAVLRAYMTAQQRSSKTASR